MERDFWTTAAVTAPSFGLMRDRGFNFFWQDLYAKNIHARTFEYKQARPLQSGHGI